MTRALIIYRTGETKWLFLNANKLFHHEVRLTWLDRPDFRGVGHDVVLFKREAIVTREDGAFNVYVEE